MNQQIPPLIPNRGESNALKPEDFWRPVSFHATGAEYFRIWIVNLVLTILTLGIYSAWASVRERRYLYGNVEVAKSRFDFHGKPLQILLGRLVALILLLAWTQGHYIHYSIQFVALVIIFLLFPWFLVRAMSFRLRNTSLRNLRFNFQGTIPAAYGIFGKYVLLAGLLVAAMVWASYAAFSDVQSQTTQELPNTVAWGQFATIYLLVMVAFGFLYPAFVCDMRRFSINNTCYGDYPFQVELRKVDFIKYFWSAIGLVLIATVVVGMVLSVGLFASFGRSGAGGVVTGIFIGYLLFGLCYLVAYAYWQVRTFNLMFASLGLEGLAFSSGLRVMPLSKILLSNTLILILSLGFAYPWIKVRLMRYKLEAIEYKGNVDHFSGVKVSADTALGDEVGDAFDLDFGFGF